MTVEVFDSSTSWICPSGVTSVLAECWGGGGGGAADGGGGGAYSAKTITVVPTTSYTVNPGTAGVAWTSGGGDSWFINSSTVLAKGGELGNDNESTNGFGGAAGSGVGDTKYSGGSGTAENLGNGGGSSAGTASNGADSVGTTGGVAPTGGGNGGDGGGDSGVASVGVAPGGGGGGSPNGTPANGAAGRVRLTYTAGGGGGAASDNRVSTIPMAIFAM